MIGLLAYSARVDLALGWALSSALLWAGIALIRYGLKGPR